MIDVKDLSVTYYDKKRQVEALKKVSLQLNMGKVVAIVGESGSGKSTLMMSILGLLPENTAITGKIIMNGKNILELKESEIASYRWDHIALIPQGAMNSFTPVITVGDHIKEVLKVHSSITGKESQIEIDRLLDEVSLEMDIANRYPHELSGGQKQRAAIALALACAPYFLLADEPTTALDVITQAEIISLLANLVQKRGMGMALVTHDIALASTFCDRIAVIHEGQLVDEGPTEEILTNPRHWHTKELVRSVKDMTI